MLYKIPCKIKQEFKWWQLRSVCEGSLLGTLVCTVVVIIIIILVSQVS